MRNVRQRWGSGPQRAKGITEHAMAKRAGGGNRFRSGAHQFLGSLYIHPLAFFLTKKHKPAAGATAERAAARSPRLNRLSVKADHLARFFVDAAVASEVTRIVEDNGITGTARSRQAVLVAGEEFAVVLPETRLGCCVCAGCGPVCRSILDGVSVSSNAG